MSKIKYLLTNLHFDAGITRSTGTVHTSAKARFTSVVISARHLANRFVSFNHFPYLPLVTNPENNPCIQTVIRITTKI